VAEDDKLSAIDRVLVVGPSWVGDMVMAQSLFKVLCDRNLTTEIDVLAPAWSKPVLDRMPEVSSAIEMPVGHGALQLASRRRIGKALATKNYDQAIVLPGSLKSALIPWFAGISVRTGYLGEHRWGLLNDIHKLDKTELPLNVQRYAGLGYNKSEAKNLNPPNPELRVDALSKKLTLDQFKLSADRPILGLCPGAEFGPAKRWPARYFAEVARVKQEEGWRIWIFGSNKDAEVAREINRLSGNSCVDLCGKTNLGEAIDLMSCAKSVVTNDSGLMHVAAAVGVHVIAIYGSSSDAFTPPLTDNRDLLNLNLSCSPCFKRECPLQHFNCMEQLTPQSVLTRLSK
jgi:heptosyltransferase-2